jgi:hypothetical protein
MGYFTFWGGGCACVAVGGAAGWVAQHHQGAGLARWQGTHALACCLAAAVHTAPPAPRCGRLRPPTHCAGEHPPHTHTRTHTKHAHLWHRRVQTQCLHEHGARVAQLPQLFVRGPKHGAAGSARAQHIGNLLQQLGLHLWVLHDQVEAPRQRLQVWGAGCAADALPCVVGGRQEQRW